MIVSASMPWINKLLTASDSSDLHAALASAHPDFKSGRLQRCAVVGAGPEGRRFTEACAIAGIEVVAIAEDNPALLGETIASAKVVSSDDLLTLDRDLPVVVASHRGHGVRQRLKAAGFSKVELLSLVQVLSPDIWSPHLFFENWFATTFEGRERIAALVERLADDESRQVLDAVIGFRLTLDPAVLEPVSDLDLYYPRGLIELGDDEVYVDGGTFDGDSIRWFIARTGGRFERVVGFEPDPRTFSRLVDNFRDEPRVVAINKGLWSRSEVLRFNDDASRGAILSDQGGTEVPVTSLDEVLAGARATYVKMNIEGAEIEALNGARKTIAAWSPRLAISLYHRPADLWDIPAVVDNIRQGYRFYLRQQDIGVIETVLYALP